MALSRCNNLVGATTFSLATHLCLNCARLPWNSKAGPAPRQNRPLYGPCPTLDLPEVTGPPRRHQCAVAPGRCALSLRNRAVVHSRSRSRLRHQGLGAGARRAAPVAATVVYPSGGQRQDTGDGDSDEDDGRAAPTPWWTLRSELIAYTFFGYSALGLPEVTGHAIMAPVRGASTTTGTQVVQ